MTRRSSHPLPPTQPLDCGPLIRAVVLLDQALQRGVLIHVSEDSLEVTDEHVTQAVVNVTRVMGSLVEEMEKAQRALARMSAGSVVLQ